MSKVLIPFIDHRAINHKFYIQYHMTNSSAFSTCYWTGIYPELDVEKFHVCAQFADALLCYDTCILTLNDYLYLISVLGFDIVNALLNEGAIEIYNNRDIKASIYSMTENDPLILYFTMEDKFNPEVKIREYQRIYNVSYNQKIIGMMQKALESSKQIAIEETWINTLNEEILNDLNNKKIITQLGLVNDGRIYDRDHDYNQFLYNRIAYLNLYMALGNTFSMNNILLPAEIQGLLDVKLGAYINSNNKDLFNAYSAITHYEGVLDIPKLLIDRTLNFYDIIRIRNNKHSREFRNWIEESSDKSSTIETIEHYNTAIFESAKIIKRESIIPKILKFVIPTGLGLIPNNTATLVASTLIGTSLFVKDLFDNKFRPNIFINDILKEEIGKKMNENMFRAENAYYIHKYGEILPDSNCPCNSGMIYKKCHGFYK